MVEDTQRKVSRSVARERAIISTTLLSRKCPGGDYASRFVRVILARKRVITLLRMMNRLEKPYPPLEIHTAELIHTEYTFSGGASDSVR